MILDLLTPVAVIVVVVLDLKILRRQREILRRQKALLNAKEEGNRVTKNQLIEAEKQNEYLGKILKMLKNERNKEK